MNNKITIEGKEYNLVPVEPDIHKAWPQKGDIVWHLNSFGEIYKIQYGTVRNSELLTQGNLFKTEQDAIDERFAREIEHELRSQPGRKKFVYGDWKSNNYIYVDEDKKCRYAYSYLISSGIFHIYFETVQDAENAITIVGEDRILKAVEIRAMRDY